MNLTRWICSFFFAGLTTFAAIPVLVNVDEANPPFMFASQGRAVGIYPRLIGAAFKRMHVPVQIEPKPWKRALGELDDGRAGLGGIYKNSERIKKYDYSDRLFVEKLMVYFNTDKPMPFAKIEDLKGKRIGVLRGWSYGDDFDDLRRSGACTVEEVASDAQNFHKLASSRLDAVIAVSESGSALIPDYKNLGFAQTPLTLNPTFLAFAKTANRSDLLKRFDLAIKEMQKSGEFQAIITEELAK